MNINRILEGLSNTLDTVNQEQTQPETATPTFVPKTETTSAEKLFDQQNYGDYLRNQIEARWQAQPQQDNFEQKAKELIDKYTPKNVALIAKFDSKGLGTELAALVPKGARLGTAVFAQLPAGDKADVARAMIDGLSDETLKKMAKTTNGKALLEQTSGLLDGATTNMWDLRSFAGGDTERKTRIETAFGKPQTGEVKQTQQTQKVQGAQSDGSYNIVTEEQVKAIILPAAPKAKKAELEKNITNYTQRLNDTMKKFGVNTPLKQAAFLATMSEESIGLTTMTENPSKYDSSRLRTKGRGIIQLTGDANYKAASERFDWGKFTIEKGKDGKERKVFTSWDLLEKPELAAKPDYAFPIAGWFWSEVKAGKNFPTANECIGLTPDPTLKDFKDASYAVNGWKSKARGVNPNGWKVRVENYERALKAFNLGDETLFQNISKITGK